MTQFTQY